MLLHSCTLYRTDMKLHKHTNAHGEVMVALKNSINCELLKPEQSDCPLTCQFEINIQTNYVCLFDNPPKGGRYRYVKKASEKLIAAVPKIVLICGDLSFSYTK